MPLCTFRIVWSSVEEDKVSEVEARADWNLVGLNLDTLEAASKLRNTPAADRM